MDKHHRRSIRLPGYDYSQNGYYSVTICTFNRESIFGDIANGKMKLNQLGIIVNHNWAAIPDHYPYVTVDTYTIMPNHIHGILNIDRYVGANDYSPLPQTDKSKPGTSKTIGAIIRGFKIGVAEWSRKQSDFFAVWQRNYYEHIIRNEKDYWAIRQYIIDNHKNWEKDELYKRSGL